MYIKRIIKFILHKRKPGETTNLGIRMRVTLSGERPLDFPIGHKIDLMYWDTETERVIDGATNKANQSSADINRAINEYKSIMNEIFARFELLEKRIPTLGDIGGIPRVLDAGQCNDSYSLVVVALKLKEILKLSNVNELPITYNIAWYEQKAVIVLLALLSLGIKNTHLGPSLPAFLSPNVVKVLVDKFDIAGIGTVDEDITLFLN